MRRLSDCVVPGLAHHVYQRGVRKEPLFHENRDFLVYIRVLVFQADDVGEEAICAFDAGR
jgi:hypothetical protein